MAVHPQRAEIELAIANGVGARTLARRYGLTRRAIDWHRAHAMPEQVVAQLRMGRDAPLIDVDALKQRESEGILSHLIAQRGRLYHLLAEAERVGDHALAVKIHKELLAVLVATARIVGELRGATHQHIHLTAAPEYLRLRLGLVDALRPYPEAARAVARVLRSLEVATPPAAEAEPAQLTHQDNDAAETPTPR